MIFNNSEIEMKDGLNWLSAGTHEVFIFDFKFDTSKSGKDFVKIHFKNENEQDHMEDFYLTPRALWRLKALSLACGINENADWQMPDLTSKKLIIHLKEEVYEKKDGSKGKIAKIFKFSPSANQNGDEFVPTSQDPF